MLTASKPKLSRAILPTGILLVVALITATISMFLIRASDAEPEPPPPYVSGQSANFLTSEQAINHLQGYLATALWAETAYVAALEEPSFLPIALNAPIPLQCAQPATAPSAEASLFLECARSAITEADPPAPWQTLPDHTKNAAATTMLSNLWRSTDPMERMRLSIIWREGVDPTDTPAIQSLQLEFDHCPEAMMARRHQLTNAETDEILAASWLAIADAVEECADRTATRIFTTKP